MMPPAKRPRLDPDDEVSEAEQLNRRVLRKLENAMLNDPTVDLTTLIPKTYSERLALRKETHPSLTHETPGDKDQAPTSAGDVAEEQGPKLDSLPSPPPELHIPFEFSAALKILLGLETLEHGEVHRELQRVLKEGEVIWRSQFNENFVVIRCNDDIAVKVIRQTTDLTEFTALHYFEKHAPDLPCPKGLGVISDSRFTYIFMTYMPGVTLDTIWKQLDHTQKALIRSDLERFFDRLRALPVDNMPLGGFGGEPCKDTRRHSRMCPHPVHTVPEFVDFIFSNPHYGGRVYLDILRGIWPTDSKVCMTHGDLKPCNILVQLTDDGNYRLSGIIDWERSGVYPEWYECNKATDMLTPTEAEDDWAAYLPPCMSPETYPLVFVLDRLWDSHVV
ncbi:hypothetical protein H2204_014874 [Knufia peltigerae]|uniref:Aminoglycoside phosphotransferase domain-containing protein n=1 Tax=Knufia peltigerae TaxID=1002370 RepID=A0AA39CM14_9EURO|nr:hypothetical protein H2204_014874 [Knufia peltigerae]